MAVGSWAPIAAAEILYHGWFSPWTPIVSLMSIPLLAGLVYPLSVLLAGVCACFGTQGAWMQALETLSWIVSEATVRGVWILEHISSVWGVRASGPMLVALAIVAALLVLLMRKQTWALVPAAALMLAVGSWRGETETTQVTQLSVGQGDAAIVLSPRDWGWIDTGPPRWRMIHDWLGGQALARSPDPPWVMLTHWDQDHRGGIESLAYVSSLRCISAPPLPRGKHASPTVTKLIRDRKHCVPFPTAAIELRTRTGNPKPNGNMLGVAIPVATDGLYVNLGDASTQGERELWGQLKQQIPQTRLKNITLKLSHHGSRTSSSIEFLQTLHPSRAWISAGARNRYGHPHPEILQRLAQAGIPTGLTFQNPLKTE